MLVLCSAAGAPGVTTTALALTLAAAGDALLVDADRQPAHAIAAGFLGGSHVGGRGLSALARLQREGRPIAEELLGQCVALSAEHARHWLLPGFSHASGPALFEPLWAEFAAALERVRLSGFAVIVDAGRVGEGLPGPLSAAAHTIALVTRTDLRSLAGARLALAGLTQFAVQGGAARVGLVLIGEGQPYTRGEIEAEFGVPVLGQLPDDPASARCYSHGDPRPGRFENRPYARAARALAAALVAPEVVR